MDTANLIRRRHKSDYTIIILKWIEWVMQFLKKKLPQQPEYLAKTATSHVEHKYRRQSPKKINWRINEPTATVPSSMSNPWVIEAYHTRGSTLNCLWTDTSFLLKIEHRYQSIFPICQILLIKSKSSDIASRNSKIMYKTFTRLSELTYMHRENRNESKPVRLKTVKRL